MKNMATKLSIQKEEPQIRIVMPIQEDEVAKFIDFMTNTICIIPIKPDFYKENLRFYLSKEDYSLYKIWMPYGN